MWSMIRAFIILVTISFATTTVKLQDVSVSSTFTTPCNGGRHCAVSTDEQGVICHWGYTLQNGTCIKKVEINTICPPECEFSSYERTCTCNETGMPVCPVDYYFENTLGMCVKRQDFMCSPGFEKLNGRCMKVVVVPPKCPPGYDEKDELCVKFETEMPHCPGGFILAENGTCIKKYTYCNYYCKGDACSGGSCNQTGCGGHSCWGANGNYSFINNHVRAPTNINSSNVNTIHITTYGGGSAENSSDETVIVNPCCWVFGPRQCKFENSEWQCWHTKHRRCGSFCRKDIIYIRPRRIIQNFPIIVIPPHYYSYWYRDSERGIDCSGCYNSWDLIHCSVSCSRYECDSFSCGYEDQESFCGTYGGAGCSKDDGCFEESFCL